MAIKVSKTSRKSVKKTEPAPTESKEVSRSVHPLLALREEIDNAFDNVFSGFHMSPFSRRAFALDPFKRFEDTFSAFGGGFAKLTLKADIKESDKAFTVSAELPGIEEDEIDVSVSDGAMTISAEKKEEKRTDEENYHLSERHYGAVKRSFPLPDSADADKAKAAFKNGVLTITLPKKAASKSKVKKIAIKG